MIRNKKILIYSLFFFSIYCALIIGESWDEWYYTGLGKRNLIYLFTLGRVEPHYGDSNSFSSLYWNLQYFFSQLVNYKYQTEINHLINLLFSFSAIFAFSKIGKQLFNKKISEIFFLLLFFYPAFFGHMGQNPKDTILVFCHLWIFSLILIRNSSGTCFIIPSSEYPKSILFIKILKRAFSTAKLFTIPDNAALDAE